MPGAVVRGPSGDERTLYVTVDDGPDASGTPRWLDALDRHGARAVFFLSAGRAEARPDLVRAIVDAGHRVGNHGDAHVSAWRTRPREVRAGFERAERVLEDLTGEPVRDVRPPYGRVTPSIVRWARAGNRRIVLWDVMPGDFLPSRSPSTLADEVVRLARPGSIVALHDGAPAPRAIAALDLALPRLAAAGWRFPALPPP
ncbi:polysaccharide deacetylase family protein [Rubrivirga sp.]|uniref:polysaccharide deacetylase family protein n=1 Tax=Rubrivirga sp. TaxID=1885344 RepID=UPI003B523D9E